MDFIASQNRNQVEFFSLEERIEKDNPVRFIEAFVTRLELEKVGFKVATIKREGRPGFDSQLFLKIYLYGYINGQRSSRKLERECKRNIEMQWLTGNLAPNYHSIADFRKLNPIALTNTFKLFVSFLKDTGMVGAHTVAIDGTKVRAHNSKKNNYNQKKIDRHLAYIEAKANEYVRQLEDNDKQDDSIEVRDIAGKLERLKGNKIKYELLQEQLIESGESQVSITDTDSRALLVQGQVVEVSYNVQAAVDQENKLVIATHTINRNDRNALFAIAKEAKSNLAVKRLTILSDKGYHNGRELQRCKDNEITTIVAQQEIVNSQAKGTSPAYLITRFTYNQQEDTYTCPEGKTLRTKGTWHSKKRDEHNIYTYKKYRTPDCTTCPVKALCTGKARGGREIERSEYAEAVEQNNERYRNNSALYRQRQEINEHIFGTIKRQWGYNHTNLRGLSKVNGEMSLIMLVYNIKRCLNMLGLEELIKKLNQWKPDYSRIWRLYTFVTQLRAFWQGKKNSISYPAENFAIG